MITRRAAFLAGVSALLAIPAFASADFSWDFNTVISGGTPGGPTPWANLTGTQSGSDVNFLLTFNDFVGAGEATEFIKELDLLYGGTFDGTQGFSYSDSSIVGTSIGSFTDAGLSFNLSMDFETSNAGGGANRVKPGDTVVFTITNVSADDFTTGMLHINGLADGGSSKVGPGPVPEPASMAALGMGALGLLARRRRK